MAKTPQLTQRGGHSELSAALIACRKAFIGLAGISAVCNLLMLTGSIYMLEIYDRVLPSRSVPTLIGISILAAALFAAQGLLDLLRSRVLVRVGSSLDEALGERVYDTLMRLPLRIGRRSDNLQPLRDLDNVRSFLSGFGPIAFYDLPWLPFYLAVCFAFHPWIGMAALSGAVVLVSLTLITELLTRRPTRDATAAAILRNSLADASQRNAEALAAMGMSGRMGLRWSEANARYMRSQRRASDVAGGLGAISKVLRMIVQSGVLGVGAYLVINQQATAGIIIAGSILSARALAPVDLAIANWRSFVAARQSWQRLKDLLAAFPAAAPTMRLQPPVKTLAVQHVGVAPPGEQKLVVHDIDFELEAGNALGIIGPSASGKSCLARAIVGIWPPARGHVRLDGISLDQWAPDALGAHIGYLPQDVELIAGTVAENIARFEPDADADEIIRAAKAAGVHDMIAGLRNGYDTQVGEQGSVLSAGQAQRIALARALYRDPFVVVLDEPNSNLDGEGDEALARAILGVRERGAIAVVVAHRPSAIAGVNLVLVMNQGRQQAFGPKEEVLAKVLQRVPAVPRVVRAAADGGGG